MIFSKSKSEEEWFECENCKKRFRRNFIKIKIIRLEDDWAFVFICPHCGARLKRKMNRRGSIRRYANNNGYCDNCKKYIPLEIAFLKRVGKSIYYYCPVCQRRLRVKPRSSKFKRLLRLLNIAFPLNFRSG